jgi:hypothetical protein
LVIFPDGAKLEEKHGGQGYELAATRAALRSKVKDGKLTIEAKLCVSDSNRFRLHTVA